MLPLKPTDKSLQDNFLPQNTTMELAYIRGGRKDKDRYEEKTDLEMYEWNALAMSRIDFPSVSNEEIRPLWYAIFSSQKRVSTHLDLRWPSISFILKNQLRFLSLHTRNTETYRRIDCLNIWRNKYSIAHTDKLESIMKSKDAFKDSFIIEDMHGRILLSVNPSRGDSGQPYASLAGPKQFMGIEFGFSTIHAISNEMSELWSLDLDTVCFNEHTLHFTRVPQFAGLRIASVSSVQHTAILTSESAVFITGPLFSHLPGPYMIRWEVPDDVIVSCEMSLTCLMLATKRGHIYRLFLTRYWQHPQLIYADETHSATKIKFCGNNTFLALTRQHTLLIWFEDTDVVLNHDYFGQLPGVYSERVAYSRLHQSYGSTAQYPPHILSRASKPTPVVLPWPVEDAALFDAFLFVSSTRRFSHNAMFANFLNRAALTTPGLPPSIWGDINDINTTGRSIQLPKNRDAQAYFLEQFRDYGYQPRKRATMGYSYRSADRRTLNGSSSTVASSSNASTLNTSADASSSYSSEDTLNKSYEVEASSSSTNDTVELVSKEGRAASLTEIGYGQYSYPYPIYRERKEALSGYSAAHGYGTVYRPSAAPSLSPSVGLESERPLYAFNSKLLAVYSMRSVTNKDRFLRQLHFARLNTEFLEMATQVVKTIVEEMNLPDEKKTYASLPSAGGIAGGEKYFVGGEIFVKLCVDNNSLYGGNEWSGKVANLELHGMDAYAKISMSDERLRVPLLTMVEYLGFRALVSTACPISKRTIVYGSNNAALTVHRDDTAHHIMLSCAYKLNLAPHMVKNCELEIASAVDVEVHRGEDGYFYLIDAARVFPPVLPDVVKSVPLSCNFMENVIQAKDLSDGQATAIMEGMASLPISEGVLFFAQPSEKDTKEEDSLDLMDTLSLSMVVEAKKVRERDVNASQRMKVFEGIQPGSRHARSPIDGVHRPWETLKTDLSRLDQLPPEDKNPVKNQINAIATAILGRMVRGDAWILKNAIGQRLFHQFRPEFVRSFSKPMSSDALSNFSVNGQAHDRVVTEASMYLQRTLLDIVKQQYLSASPYLDNRLPSAWKQPEAQYSGNTLLSPLIYSPETLVRFLHSVGVNVRYLGYLRNCIDAQAFKSIALIEMVARSCSSFIKRRLRASHALHATCQAYLQKESQGASSSQGAPTNSSYSNISLDDWDTLSPDALVYFGRNPLDHLMKTIAVQAFNTIFDNSATSNFFWTQVTKVQLLVKFGPECLNSYETHRTYSLREDVPMAYLFQAVSRRTGVIWDDDTMSHLESAQWATTSATFSLDQVLGFSITTKSTAMGSLQKVKEQLRDLVYPTSVRVPTKFSTSTQNDAHMSSEVLGQFYSNPELNNLEAKSSGPVRLDPMYLAPNYRPAKKSLLEEFAMKNATLWSGKPYMKDDGLDTYHNRTILFYQKWVSTLKKSMLKPSPLDEVRLMLSKIRPILDNCCPDGPEQLATVEASWLEIIEKMKTISHCNQELLAQLFYARGQMVELRGDQRQLAGDYYFAALNTLATANFSEPARKDERHWICYKPTLLAKTHHFMTHPFAMLVIEKILLLELEASGSIISSFRLMALFRQLWVTCPFLGDANARRRIFNGRMAPLALSDPSLWTNSGARAPDQILPNTSDNLSKEHPPLFAFVPYSVFSLQSAECQFWLSQVLDLEPTCGFEVSTHWLFQEPSNYPNLLLRSFPSALDFPSFVHTPTFQPTSPLRVVHSFLDTYVDGGATDWCWWYYRHTRHLSSEFLQIQRSLPSSDLALSLSLHVSNSRPPPNESEILLFYALHKACELAGSTDFLLTPSEAGFALPRDREAQAMPLGPEEARSSQVRHAADPTKISLFALGNFVIHESGGSINTFSKLLEMRNSALLMLKESNNLGSAAVAPNFQEASNRLEVYGPIAKLLHGARIKFYVKNDVSHQSAYFQNNDLFKMDELQVDQYLCASVQYLDPNLPTPKRYQLAVSATPEGYEIQALPLWFDEFGILSVERYDYHCFFSKNSRTMRNYSFYSITSRGTLISAMPSDFVQLSNQDVDELKYLNFAGETPILLGVNKMRPKKVRHGYYHLTYYWDDHSDATLSFACITRDGHLFVWGSNKTGLLGTGRTSNQFTANPKLVSELSASKIIDFQMGNRHIAILNELGDIYMWGYLLPLTDGTFYVSTSTIAFEQTRHQPALSPIPKVLPLWGGIVKQRAVAVSAALHSVTAVSEFGIPYHLGFRADQETFSVDWIRIWCSERIVSVVCGDFHVVMLSENGNIFAYGKNDMGQCGMPFPLVVDGINRCLAPIQFHCNAIAGSYSLKFVQIVACRNHSIALTDTGDVWLWGSVPRSSPYRIRTPAPIKYISMNNEGRHVMCTEMPDLPPRTLPLVSSEYQREQVLKIDEHQDSLRAKAQLEAVAKAEAEALRRRIREQTLRQYHESAADAKKLTHEGKRQTTEPTATEDQKISLNEVSATQRPTPNTIAVASSSNEVPNNANPDLEGQRVRQAENESAALQPRSHGPPGEDPLPRASQLSLEFNQIKGLTGPYAGTWLYETINRMISDAVSPLQAQIDQLKHEVAKLKKLEQAKSQRRDKDR